MNLALAIHRLKRSVCSAFLATVALGACAADEFPTRPIQLVVGLPPGSVSDITAREVAARMQRHLGQTVIVVNRPGANLLIATEAVKNAAADGHTILFATTGWANVPTLYRKPPYRREDFTAVGSILEDYAAFVADPKAGASLQAWVARAKEVPGRHNLASLGPGSAARLISEKFAKSAAFTFTEVPYQGFAPVLVALQSGEVQGYFGDIMSAVPQHQAGRVRILAVTRADRIPSLPDVPTFAEQGYTDMSLKTWYGIVAPAATPAPIVNRLNEALNAALADPDLRQRLERNGGTVKPRSVAEFHTLINSEAESWRRVIEPLNIKLDAQ